MQPCDDGLCVVGMPEVVFLQTTNNSLTSTPAKVPRRARPRQEDRDLSSAYSSTERVKPVVSRIDVQNEQYDDFSNHGGGGISYGSTNVRGGSFCGTRTGGATSGLS